VFSGGLLERLYTGIGIAEKLHPADEFRHIRRYHGFQGDSYDWGSLRGFKTRVKV
jgi:hypothetical protein